MFVLQLVFPFETSIFFVCFLLPVLMAQWCARDFIAELSSIEKLVSMRPSSDIQPKLVTQLRDRLVHSRWTADELCSMVQSVGACSLSDISKDTLLKALDDAACPTLASQSQVKLTSKPQTLVQIFNYLSKQDWTRMASSSSWDSTVIMSERLKRCGLTSLKEETKKWATAVILNLQVQRSSVTLTYDQVYYLAEQLHEHDREEEGFWMHGLPAPPARARPSLPRAGLRRR